ncbi:MAG: HNH endonuclease signature motif containing protein, partial [Nocardioides sp.]|nr:HNH endonuclease signature motif containing protein [Nocardioides sp.]
DAVTAAVAQLDAEEAAHREAVRADRRGVHLDRERLTGLPERWTDLHARLDTPDAEALDATLDRLADVLERNAMVEAPHDPDLAMTHRHWRARALGLLADPHLAAEVLDSAATGEQVDTRRGAGVLYVHVRADGDNLAPAVDLERYGTTTLDLARAWLGDRAKIQLRPVLHPDRADAVDAHDPPEWMRELVILRDRTCVFPGCRTSARRSDLDHIEPYVPPDDGGPPGQTRPENLAALCRRHHRLKTHGGWTYRRAGEGYTWDPPARAT